MEYRKLLITGCARSGTTYIATVLRRIGVDIGHEYVRSDGTVSSLFAVDDLGPAIKRKHDGNGERRGDFQFGQVWHQIRDPLAGIPSAAKVMRKVGWEWNTRHTGADPNEPRMMMAARYWLLWNRLIQRSGPDWTYRVESLPLIWHEMVERLVSLGCSSVKKDQPRVKTNMNRGKSHLMINGWDHLAALVQDDDLCREIRDDARGYGYDV